MGGRNLFAIADVLEISAYWLMSGIGQPSGNADRNDTIRAMLDEAVDRIEPVVRKLSMRA